MRHPRLAVAGLALSASALVGIAVHEGYRDRAYIPVAGDRPTIGFGDATGVQMGDRTDPVRALIRLGEHVERKERELKVCIGDVPLHQHEWDAIVSWAYNVGTTAACRSTLVRKLKAGDYAGACAELLRWDKFQGRVLPGLTKRRADEYRQCMGAQG
ncbi:glycoside hydrolase family protein [Quisquiliibacterium transsilvanicum]|uniref:Lysozyme n=1 Tax=Quisquiliibacterium transsilvanicum TaxID=1549638 RepID=A0A7W8HGC1_9BURK|nr:lysozyme [Quisquiliibacterium transsilvanicum]